MDLPDAGVWLSYCASAASERGTAIGRAAEAEDIRPTKALEVAENPTALRAAILADASTARAARAALLDRVREDPGLQAEPARDVVRTDDPKKAVAGESRAADRIGYVRQIRVRPDQGPRRTDRRGPGPAAGGGRAASVAPGRAGGGRGQPLCEDDMVRRLEELQQAIGGCLAALCGARGGRVSQGNQSHG